MRTDLFQCERENKTGYNSSILIWNSDEFEKIYTELKKNFSAIMKFIVRFDYWLEMMVKHPHYIQDCFETQIADYTSDCQETLPNNARIICFPRYPKPHEVETKWIQEYWINEPSDVKSQSK